MNISSSWISLCGVLAAVCAVQATYTFYTTVRCECNGRSRYCLRDAKGLHCVDCQGNTEGRHCERCKDGFYLQGAGVLSELHVTVGGAAVVKKASQEDNATAAPTDRSDQMAVHKGPDGWRAATAQGVTPDNVHFRWSPKYQDLEVISKNSLPVYLDAPALYLGNQLLSYGQNFSFSLRLDRGVRHPSTNDVILEGSGLRVSASLGDLRSIVPCGQKISYSFRLDEQPGSRWRPQLSAFQFQSLLQNLTAIKIRATFGENGRGYLNKVQLGSAQRGPGMSAGWVQTCRCPLGYEGEFCERCSTGFKRRVAANGAFSPCEPCSCRGGSCDPQTGDCYSADETPSERSCSDGFYRDPQQPRACVKCPCAEGVSCSLPVGSQEPRCDLCPPGATGSRCDICQEGFYRVAGVQQPCRPCQCNGHIDVSVAGSCDRSSGECLKCVNNTMGQRCEECRPGFYHSRPADACKRKNDMADTTLPKEQTTCDCEVLGSESGQCDDLGRCRCKPGFEGLRCQRSTCPACFSPIKDKMEAFAAKLQELERLFSDMDGGLKPGNSAEMEAALRAAEELVSDLKGNTEQLTELEEHLKARLSSISRSQLTEGQDIQNIADVADEIKQRQQMYKTKVETVQTLMEKMKRKLVDAKAHLQSAEFPLGDAPLGSNIFSLLVQTAMSLADKHQTKAEGVERSANDALSDSEKSLSLVRTLMNKENKVKELIGDLKATYDQTSAQVKGFENQATRLSNEARDESKMADSMLKAIATMEQNIPSSMKEEMDAMVTRLDGLKEAVNGSISGYEAMQDGVQRDKAAAEDLLAKGKAAQQESNKLLDRVNVAKADTEGALQRITSNMGELDDALNTLKGFDQQITGSRVLADAAIKRLPAINATIQQAVNNNAETLSVLEDVSDDYNSALGSINLLENLVSSLEGTFESLPSHAGPVNEATKLNKDATGLRSDTTSTAKDVAFELNNQPGAVDESHVKKLEDSLADALKDVEVRLRPRLRDMEEQEAAQRRQLSRINLDINTILGDIANLEDILRAVPNGCFNSPPIEEA
ncbi:hypothetical protein PAMP_005384 [Pampus punctatissimus]